MEAEISDDAVWEVVKKKLFDGLKVYSVDDFHTELRNAVKRENEELKKTVDSLRVQINQISTENRQMKAALSTLDGL